MADRVGLGLSVGTDIKIDRDRYAALAFCWGDLLFEVDRMLDIVFAAGPTMAFTGRAPKDLQGVALRDLVAPADVPLMVQIVKSASGKRRMHGETVRLRTPQGSLLPMQVAGYTLDPDRGYFIAFRLGAADAPPLHPTGTMAGGLMDGGTFASLASQRLKDLEAVGEKAEVTLVSLPGIGDLGARLDEGAKARMLQELGTALQSGSVGGDSAAQVGEGQYSLLCAADSDIAGLVRRVEEIARKNDPKGEGVTVVSASLPIADVADVSEEDLARGLMYAINRFREDQGSEFSLKTLSASMGSLVESATRDVNDFKSVVAHAQFDIAVQPIVDVHTGEIHHYEALCRFHASAGESPYRHIVFAEETGLIPDFDLAMARKAVEWLTQFPRNSDKHHLAVNLSGFSIGKPLFVAALHRLLKENLWTQGKLLFEITESSRMSDLDAANGFIQGLRKWGYEVCLDDFGAGAASFQYLSTLEIDVVKLDGSAVRNAQRAAKGRAFLTALTALCRRLGVQTIAEMIDSPESFDFVRDCGCDYAQGYLFGKPSKLLKDFDPLPMASVVRRRG